MIKKDEFGFKASYEPIREGLVHRIRALRKEGHTYKNISAKLNLSISSVCKVVSGTGRFKCQVTQDKKSP